MAEIALEWHVGLVMRDGGDGGERKSRDMGGKR